jgi:hypothetical protein
MARPKLTKGEQKKLIFFLGLLFAVANLLAIGEVRKAYAKAADHLRELEVEDQGARAWLEDRDLWTARKEWLAKKQPKAAAGDQGNVALLETLQKLAAQHHLAIGEQSLKDPAHTPYHRAVSVQLQLTGSLESLCRWLADVQQPELFQEVTDFSLKSEGETDSGTIRCNLTVARLFPNP